MMAFGAKTHNSACTITGTSYAEGSWQQWRDGKTVEFTIVLPCARAEHDRMWDVEIGLTAPVRLAVETAAAPIAFGELAATVAGELSGGTAEAERLLAVLVNAGVLLSALRPPMTVTDPAAHLARHTKLPDPGDRVAVDLRVDRSVTLPPAMIREAEDAASALVAVAPHLPGWAAYHRAFIA